MGIGGATILVSLPLVLKLVPMNRYYGVRLPKAFISAPNWYAINAYGGRLLVLFGLFLTSFGYLTRDAAPPATSGWAPLYLIAPLLPLLPVLWLIRTRARRLPDQ